METYQGKHAWIVKIGERGQFVIPKEAREMFDLKPGSSVLVLADEERGLAIPTRELREKMFNEIFSRMDMGKEQT